MRAVLIALQAAIITLFAVIGASGDSDRQHNCPLPSALADRACQSGDSTDL